MANKKRTNNNQQNNFNGGKPSSGFSLTWLYIAIAAVLIFITFRDTSTPTKEVEYSALQSYIDSGYVEKIVVVTNENIAEVSLIDDSVAIKNVLGVSEAKKYTKKPQISCRISSAEQLDKYVNTYYEKTGKNISVKYEERKDYFSTFLWSFGPILFFILLWVIMSRRMSGGGGGIFSVGRSKAQVIEKGSSKMNVTFKDVAGLSEAKQEVQEIVEFLKNPSKFTALGGKIPKGASLVGPPGTGKTLLAKAVAGEANVPFFSLSGSDFVEMFVGVGASRVRDLFRQAKEKSPCIIFIDEIDAVGRARGKNPSFNSNDERENTLNQLLTEMDGFGTNSGIIILAATNRADILDKALLRAGRFDRQISVDLPDVHERKEIFEVHLKPIKLADGVDLDLMAKQTPGFSGADIANVCNEAALIAARRSKKSVDKQDFMDAIDRIIGGLEKKNKITTAEEKRSIAIHEAGHASVSWLLEYANPLVKVTIVPRGKALGAAWYLPEERQLTTTEQMLDEMCSLLGGRAAEQVVLGKVSTGALNDLERATKMAYSMVVYYGMSDKLKNLSYFDSTQSDYTFTKPFSEKTSEIIDSEIKSIVQKQFERAVKIIEENREKHAALADILVDKEVIFADDVTKIFGPRKWKTRMEEITEINSSTEKKEDKEENNSKEDKQKKNSNIDE